MAATRLILVGGFLGAGKTTLLAEAAKRLTFQGKRVGMVANDQAADLVDSEVFKATGSVVEEVAGGCFCCRFPDLISSLERLARDGNVDVLLGEPVGSCTDLSATVLQPLKELHAGEFDLAPFSVLVDAKQIHALNRLREAAGQNPSARFPDNVLYIYERQLEEADLIVLNKTDLLSVAELDEIVRSLAERFPNTSIVPLSAATGEGIDAWIERIGQHDGVGRKIVEVDYDTYAAGEASLGWLNASVRLRAGNDTDWAAFATDLLESLRDDLTSVSAEIAHVKLHMASTASGSSGTPGSQLVGNVTNNAIPAALRGNLSSACHRVSLLLNARVHISPETLQTMVEGWLQMVAGAHRVVATVMEIHSLAPGRPQPTYRYGKVV